MAEERYGGGILGEIVIVKRHFNRPKSGTKVLKLTGKIRNLSSLIRGPEINIRFFSQLLLILSSMCFILITKRRCHP